MFNSSNFTKDLKISQEIINKLSISRTDEELKVFALSLPDLKQPDTYILAGRILISLSIKTCPRKIEDYVSILEDVLHKDIKKYMLANASKINTLLEETFNYNFKNYSILSASSCINYLLSISKSESPVETPCQMFLRIAIQLYYETSFDDVKTCYMEMLEQHYVHASPTMFNAGTRKNQMSSCFLLTMGDNLESLLYSGAGDVGMISKLQGGIGLSMNAIRHSEISNSGSSSGVLPFGRIYDSTIRCVDQGGKRNGAMTITLNDWHIDFVDFIQSRDNYTQNGIRFKQANICAFVSNLFMKRVKENKKWTMFCPAKAVLNGEKLYGKSGHQFEVLYEKMELEAEKRNSEFNNIFKQIVSMEKNINSGIGDEKYFIEYQKLKIEKQRLRKNLIAYKTLDARDIYKIICDMNNKSSMPYIVYRDPVNYKNNMKNIGQCEGLNLCLEIIEPSTPDSIASCNLGHINLKKFVKCAYDPSLKWSEMYDFELLGKASRSLTRNINKVIDYNYYPLDERDSEGKVTKKGKISTPNFQNRPLGIGVSGLSEVFSLLSIPYESQEAHTINKMIFACMYFHCMKQSMMLAKVEGMYENFKTGTSELYIDGKWQTVEGSPLSNGYFQFDLWSQEAEMLKDAGFLDTSIYNMDDNNPIEPTMWDEDDTWDNLRQQIKEFGVRNSMCIALMPTASSAQLLRNAETTEAHQTLVYSRKLTHGNFTAFSEPFVYQMVEEGLWNQEVIDFIMMENGSIKNLHQFFKDNKQYFPESFYEDDSKLEKIKHMQKLHKGMYEISQKVTMQMARQRGIYVCQSQSFNIYIAEPNIKKMQSVHNYSNSLQLKTGMYYLRQNPASQTSRFTVDLDIQQYHKNLQNKKKVVCTEDVCLVCQ